MIYPIPISEIPPCLDWRDTVRNLTWSERVPIAEALVANLGDQDKRGATIIRIDINPSSPYAVLRFNGRVTYREVDTSKLCSGIVQILGSA